MKILGIDPGTATTGYGIINSDRNKLTLIEYGCIKTAKTDKPEARLLEIFQDLTKLIKKHKPGRVVIEKLFFLSNVTTAMAVSQSRGVALLAAAINQVPIVELTPLQVKNSLTNYGKADKKQVQHMVKTLLDLNSVPKPDDAADALALAICGANY